ncbi:MAG: hypothetical protein IPL65_20925, partial [Lewinellaceae bacterium]|nr:hypothetical protein [Lewinellaceae bacterium]
MTSRNTYFPSFDQPKKIFFKSWLFIPLLAFGFLLFQSSTASALTVVYQNQTLLASNVPFNSLPAGVDTIILKNSTLDIDITYEPIMQGMPFQGVLLLDNGFLNWTGPVSLKLGYNAKVVLINGGKLLPDPITSADCIGIKRLFSI